MKVDPNIIVDPEIEVKLVVDIALAGVAELAELDEDDGEGCLVVSGV